MKSVAIFSIDEDLQEIRSLLDTLNYEACKEYVQKRNHPHRVSYLGPGKIDEILKEMETEKPDLIVVNGKLKPSQHHYLEMKFQMEFLDRPGLILRIFADHAHTPEAIAQVTLAKLRYELPFLREWIHKAKSGDRPGFLAGGAYATDVYFEHAKSHARRIEKSLEELSLQRETTRAKRHATGYSLVSLSGYTNAGKSALMNALCDSEVEVDDRLFSTLSTTTRKISGVKANVLVTDTVGFIQDLPPDLVDAFASTLEEIFNADLILLVLDVSERMGVIESKLKTSFDILLPRIENRDLVVVGNKIDLISETQLRSVRERLLPSLRTYEFIAVSAKSGEEMDCLRDRILGIQNYSCEIEAQMPTTDMTYSLLSRLRSSATITMSQVHDHVEVTVRCKPDDVQKITGRLEAAGGTMITSRYAAAQTDGRSSEDSTGSEGAPLKP